jgi:protein-tyrosine-phosphatase
MTTRPPFKVLFLCTGNSARSVIAEHILRVRGHERFEAFSAGGQPATRVHPLALAVLANHFSIDASAARPESWDELREIRFDFIITLCDKARENCPSWPGQPVYAHWSCPDPTLAEGTEAERARAFLDAKSQITSRIALMTSFRDEQLTEMPVRSVGDQLIIPDPGSRS